MSRFNMLSLIAGPSKRPLQTALPTLRALAPRSSYATQPTPTSASALNESPEEELSTDEMRRLIESMAASADRPYTVERTENGELPVYSKIRSGNHVKTIIRRVKGDVMALQRDLNRFLELSRPDPLGKAPKATVRQTNKHVEIKGRKVTEVKSWLEAEGH